jgi:hypothetical protein
LGGTGILPVLFRLVIRDLELAAAFDKKFYRQLGESGQVLIAFTLQVPAGARLFPVNCIFTKILPDGIHVDEIDGRLNG